MPSSVFERGSRTGRDVKMKRAAGRMTRSKTHRHTYTRTFGMNSMCACGKLGKVRPYAK